MAFGVFHEFPSLVNRPVSEAFAEAFDICDGAECWGLDVMWRVEFHFDPPRFVLSSPMVSRVLPPSAPNASRWVSRCRCCRWQTLCASPRKPRRSIISARGG